MRILLLAALLLAIAPVPTTVRAADPASSPSIPQGRVDPPVPVPEPSPLALEYYRSGVALWLLGEAWMVLVPAVVLFSGLSARIRDLARRIGRKWFLAVGLYGVFYLGLYTIATLPFAYYTGFVRPHAYGLSTETLGRWLSDEAKEFGLSALMALLFLWFPYLALERMPRRWWIAVTAGYVPIAFTLMFLAPIVVDPLFNRFGPMKDRALEAKILALADRAGIDGGRIYEVDKSEQTKTINAYVKGFLETKRIVLWDTLIQRLDERETLFVMGHEMGHYVLGHVVRSLLLGTIAVLATVFSVHVVANALIRRFSARFGFDRIGDVASLPLLLMVGNLFAFALGPVGMAYSRHQEHEADRFALEITQDNHAGASAFAKMQTTNLSNPRPDRWVSFLRGTHPTLGDRIDFCNSYHPWISGKPSVYAPLFREPAKSR